MALTISSPEFKHQQPIPAKFTCQGENINPTLEIKGTPAGAKTLVLIMDDPDAPMPREFVHWILFNIPAQTTKIAEHSIPLGSIQGKNSANENQYIGPCPPSGSHRYFFKLYALDGQLDLNASATRAEVEAAMTRHILEQTALIGTYQKQG